MKTKHGLFTTLIATLPFWCTTIVAQQTTRQTIDSPLGKLELEDGYPTKETAEKLYGSIDFQRACQAFLWALPAVGFHGLHLAQLNTFDAKDGDIVLYEDLKDKAGMLTPNITTLYAMSFWNLGKQGPLVIEVPQGATAGGVLDIWQRPVTDTGQTGPDKGQGGKYLIIGPNAEEPKAEGYIIKRSPTEQIWFATRGLSPERKAAEETVRQHQLYSWNDRDSAPKTKYIPVGGKDWSSAQPVGLDLHVPANPPVKQFWSITLYDNVTRGPVVTDQGAADLSSRKELAKNSDGSVDLFFGPTKPEGANDNWIKTNPGRGWFPYFRFYGPTEAYFDKSWQLPDIELMK